MTALPPSFRPGAGTDFPANGNNLHSAGALKTIATILAKGLETEIHVINSNPAMSIHQQWICLLYQPAAVNLPACAGGIPPGGVGRTMPFRESSPPRIDVCIFPAAAE
ncbi:hypothetical protein [Desulfotomaculum copahuensis]|uniref:hypothetical protein n=1 Tax=Desulfotomaculum copahuensis TaxID=1838280 RepID=UPI00124408D5|nr:hypothetical protein [Desulfotomaculum copahuensis]